MKRKIGSSICALLVCATALAQTPAAAKAPSANASQSSKAGNSADLERALDAMDKAAQNFKTAQADFVWDQYSKVVDEHDFQKGVVYYRVSGKEVQMAADITDPGKKLVLFTNGKVDVYQPQIEQVTEYNAGKNKTEFESFLVLGFGGSGHDLEKSFNVSYGGQETIQGVATDKLILAPKLEKIRNMFAQIVLWIDPARGVSVQQDFIEPSGDYRLAKYTNIKINQKIPDDVFKLKTTGKTKVVRPQG